MNDADLPELPPPALTHSRTGEPLLIGPTFTADQMRAYGRLCAEQQRERDARIVETHQARSSYRLREELATAIRNQS